MALATSNRRVQIYRYTTFFQVNQTESAVFHSTNLENFNSLLFNVT